MEKLLQVEWINLVFRPHQRICRCLMTRQRSADLGRPVYRISSMLSVYQVTSSLSYVIICTPYLRDLMARGLTSQPSNKLPALPALPLASNAASWIAYLWGGVEYSSLVLRAEVYSFSQRYLFSYLQLKVPPPKTVSGYQTTYTKRLDIPRVDTPFKHLFIVHVHQLTVRAGDRGGADVRHYGTAKSISLNLRRQLTSRHYRHQLWELLAAGRSQGSHPPQPRRR